MPREFDAEALVCRGAEIKGDVKIGKGTVVQPTAVIVAEVGAQTGKAEQRGARVWRLACVCACVWREGERERL